ncbi:MAG: aa3-type cytochrome c oxidase subunit IV [Rhodopila sp.]|nr:aa3-type cytochrome c oxidase subunit IV [Rhodopila sp.]
MASHGTARYTGPETIEALTADREKMWHGFTAATTGGVIFMIVLLIAMAVFLL